MKERKEKEEFHMVDHGSVFNLNRDGSLVVEKSSRGPADSPLLLSLLKTRKHIFIKSQRIHQAPVSFPSLNRIGSKGVKSEYAKGPSTGQR